MSDHLNWNSKEDVIEVLDKVFSGDDGDSLAKIIDHGLSGDWHTKARIATAAMQGLLAADAFPGDPEGLAKTAVDCAEALQEEIGRRFREKDARDRAARQAMLDAAEKRRIFG